MSDTVNEVVSIVSAEMGDVLSREPLDPGDDFFRHGGDSLRAVELITRLTTRFQHVGAAETERLRSELLIIVFEDASPGRLAEIITRTLGDS